MNILQSPRWGWKTSGVALASVFLLAVLLVKPIGVSTQFVILDGIIWDAISPELVVEDSSNKSGYASSNAYLNKSGGKYAGNIANPLNYSFVFVVAMVLGGLLGKVSSTQSRNLRGQTLQIEPLDRLTTKRFLLAFVGGVLVLFGARLAGGCTSGHMMSGMMQTSLSGYLFSMAAFVCAVPTAILVYSRRNS